MRPLAYSDETGGLLPPSSHAKRTGVLATDLDGTLIPLPDHPSHQRDLQRIALAHTQQQIGLIFATGRHLESVQHAMTEHDLPCPDWIVCDVGTSIYQRTGEGFTPYRPYEEHLANLTRNLHRDRIEHLLASLPGLTLQAPERQQRFKISYDSTAADVPRLVASIDQRLRDENLPYACMGSIDPFGHHGLLDVLPRGVTKAYALTWLSTHADFTPDDVVYAGDSGNDLAALTGGFRAIVVANAPASLVEEVKTTLEAQGHGDRLYVAKQTATSGVLEGCRQFGLIR